MSKTKTESIEFLSKNTARLITSNQVIVGPYNAVKELIENALDSKATIVDVRLDNFGLDKVEVKDNGVGIKKEQVSLMCLPGHSSKIKEFSDINALSTYGFRGEALAALCCVGKVSVTTKTANDPVASSYTLDSNGYITETKVSHLGQGTTVNVTSLFFHQPARRRLLLSGKSGSNIGASKSTTLSQVRTLMGALGIAWPEVRLSLIHNGSLVWRKQPVPSSSSNPLQVALGETLGHTLASKMDLFVESLNGWGKIKALIPKLGCKVLDLCQTSKTNMILLVNKRVIRHKKFEELLLLQFRSHFADLGRNKFPACVLELSIDPEYVDVNLEPDKSRLLLNSDKEIEILEKMNQLLSSYYGEPKKNSKAESSEEPSKKKLRLEEELPVNPKLLNDVIAQSTTVSKIPYFTQQSSPNETQLDINEVSAESSYFNQNAMSEISGTQQMEIKRNNEPISSSEKPNIIHSTISHSIPGLRIEINDGIVSEVNQVVIKSPTKMYQGIDDIRALNHMVDSEEEKRSSTTFVLNEQLTEIKGTELPQLEPKILELVEDLIYDSCEEKSSLISKSPLSNESLSTSAKIFLTPEDMELDTTLELTEHDQQALEELEKLYSDNVEKIHPPSIYAEETINPKFQDAWSRGHLSTKDGKPILGCSIMPPKVSHSTNISLSQESSNSPSSQMGCRELSGFSLFCKEIRPKILQESPGLLFTTVAQMLARQWKDLPSEDKQRYGELSDERKFARKTTKQNLLNSPQVQKMKNQTSKKTILTKNNDVSNNLENNSVILSNSTPVISPNNVVGKNIPEKSASNNLPSSSNRVNSASSPEKKVNKCKKKVQVKKEISCLVSIHDIKKKLESPLHDPLEQENEIIGHIQGCWLVRRGIELNLLRPWALRERLLFERLVAEMVLPLAALDIPVELNERNLSRTSLQVLASMETRWNPQSNSTEVTSEFITSNGFGITALKDDTGLVGANLTHLASSIPRYGINDLEELLQKLNNNPSQTLAQSRPLAVRDHIMNRTLKACQDVPHFTRGFEVEELLQKWSLLPPSEINHCLHNRDIFTHIQNLPT